MNKTHFPADFNPKAIFYLLILNLFLFASCAETQKTPAIVTKNLRAPAYPLVTIDPYMSAWSETDHLYDDAVRHWTGKRQGLNGALRVDGHVYRFMGKQELPRKTILPIANQGAWDCNYQLIKPA